MTVDLHIEEGIALVTLNRPAALNAIDYPMRRAIQALWYKQHKPAFRVYCKGLVRIASSAAEQQRLDTPALHAAWGVPYYVTTDDADGMRWVGQQLEQADAH